LISLVTWGDYFFKNDCAGLEVQALSKALSNRLD
jgi:hypothetical protein